MRRSTRLVLIPVAAAVVLGAAACGDNGSTATPASTTAPTNTSASPTPGDGSGTGSAAVIARVADATADVTAVKGSLTTTVAGQEVTSEFATSTTAAGTTGKFTVQAGGRTIDAVITPTALYLGGADLPLPAGKKYLKISLTDNNALVKTYKDLLASVQKQGDVKDVVEQWRALSDLKQTGVETVDGVETTRYEGSVDLKNLPSNTPDAVKKAYAELTKLGTTTVKTTLWIGPDGLPVQAKTVTSPGKAASTTVIKYSDWGKAVTVDVPKDSEVISGSKLFG